MATSIPSTRMVLRVVRGLREHGIVAAVGGSGLLASLGLVDIVGDWDLTTEATPGAVEQLLDKTGLGYSRVKAGDPPFASRARFEIDGGDHSVEVIVGFALQAQGKTVDFPTKVTRYWRKLPIGDPVAWEQAYRLLGWLSQADLLRAWLQGSGTASS